MDAPIPFPAELRPYRAAFDQYLDAKLRQFGGILLRQIANGCTPEQVKSIVDKALGTMHELDAAAAPQRPLRLVIRHDCQSTGCGDQACILCQYNPSRLCTRNVKPKYLIDDHLKAKCGAQLRVELVDDTGACHTEGLPSGVSLELHVLNGEKYKELCPDNTLLSVSAIKNCIINHHTKALLRRDGMADTELQVFLPLERGVASLSELTLTTSSEALLSGKAPTFRLLVWAVHSNGDPVPSVTYVVSESFVVATKRVKHAIKSDIPSVGDNISKLVHIGKATVDKLTDLRTAFQEEGFDFKLPEDLVKVEKVGQFRKLVDMSENNNELKNRLRHVLKLSPEKWEEVCQHALSAVSPDFRNRVWWCLPLRLGLLYACRNGAVQLENPIAIVKPGPTQDAPHQLIQLQQLSPADFNTIPRLKNSAVQNWYMTGHPNWAIYSESGEEGMTLPAAPLSPAAVPTAAGAGPSNGAAGSMPMLPIGANLGAPAAAPAAYTMPGGPPSPVLAAGAGGYGGDMYGQAGGIAYGQPEGGAFGVGAPGGLGGMPMPLAGMGQLPVPVTGGHRISASSPFAMQQAQQQQLSPALQQAQQPQHGTTAAVKLQQNLGQQPVGPAHAGQAGRERGGSVPPAAAASGNNASSGLTSGSQMGIMAGATLQPPAASGPGSNTSSAGRSPFAQAQDAMMMNIAHAFPKFPGGMAPSPQQATGGGAQVPAQGPSDPHGSTAHHMGDGAHAQRAGSMFGLDTIRTEDLMGNGLPSLAGNDTLDWLQQLHGIGGQPSHLGGIPSYTMLDVAPQHDGGGGLLDGNVAGGAHVQAGGGADGLGGAHGTSIGGLIGQESERLNSMNLGYDKIIGDHPGA